MWTTTRTCGDDYYPQGIQGQGFQKVCPGFVFGIIQGRKYILARSSWSMCGGWWSRKSTDFYVVGGAGFLPSTVLNTRHMFSVLKPKGRTCFLKLGPGTSRGAIIIPALRTPPWLCHSSSARWRKGQIGSKLTRRHPIASRLPRLPPKNRGRYC